MAGDLITLDRIGGIPEWGTFGTLRLPDGFAVKTIEDPWQNNARGKSCIPAGDYLLGMRGSPIVERTSGGQFHSGWQVLAVPGRDLIMIHPGNWAGEGELDDTEGCILVGRAHAVVRGKPGVSASRAAFADLMHRLSARESWRLAVRWTTPE